MFTHLALTDDTHPNLLAENLVHFPLINSKTHTWRCTPTFDCQIVVNKVRVVRGWLRQLTGPTRRHEVRVLQCSDGCDPVFPAAPARVRVAHRHERLLLQHAPQRDGTENHTALSSRDFLWCYSCKHHWAWKITLCLQQPKQIFFFFNFSFHLFVYFFVNIRSIPCPKSPTSRSLPKSKSWQEPWLSSLDKGQISVRVVISGNKNAPKHFILCKDGFRCCGHKPISWFSLTCHQLLTPCAPRW